MKIPPILFAFFFTQFTLSAQITAPTPPQLQNSIPSLKANTPMPAPIPPVDPQFRAKMLDALAAKNVLDTMQERDIDDAHLEKERKALQLVKAFFKESPTESSHFGMTKEKVAQYDHKVKLKECRSVLLVLYYFDLTKESLRSNCVPADHSYIQDIFDMITSLVGKGKEISWDEIQVMTEKEFLEDCRRLGVIFSQADIHTAYPRVCGFFNFYSIKINPAPSGAGYLLCLLSYFILRLTHDNFRHRNKL